MRGSQFQFALSAEHALLSSHAFYLPHPRQAGLSHLTTSSLALPFRYSREADAGGKPTLYSVIPAKAGIQGPRGEVLPRPLDPGFRRGDGQEIMAASKAASLYRQSPLSRK